MFSKVKGEFETVEFAEFAAKHIREHIVPPPKIMIYHNRNRFHGSFRNNEYGNATHGEIFYLLPTAINSYNYITGQVSRPVDKSQIDEPLLDRSVTIEFRVGSDSAEKASGILAAFGGYNISSLPVSQ
ncbi:MAG: hypothetical protein ACI4JB_04365 [Porcipelethomonas sp.]